MPGLLSVATGKLACGISPTVARAWPATTKVKPLEKVQELGSVEYNTERKLHIRKLDLKIAHVSLLTYIKLATSSEHV